MISAGKVKRIYDNCFTEASGFLNKRGFEVTNNSVKLDPKGQQLIVAFAEPLYFKSWPYRSGSKPSERIDILAEVIETIGLREERCLRSTLRLNYFLQDGEKRVACEAIHYDFNCTVQSQHPVCHAQNSNTIMARPESFPDIVDTKPLEKRHQAIRIPTAFVNFAGLFAKLAADHLPPEAVSEFWTACKAYIDEIPTHAVNDVTAGILRNGNLGSFAWYRW